MKRLAINANGNTITSFTGELNPTGGRGVYIYIYIYIYIYMCVCVCVFINLSSLSADKNDSEIRMMSSTRNKSKLSS